MSSGGGPVAAAPVVPVTPKPRRKVVTENWDDDFEFALPTKAKTAASARSPVSTPKREVGAFLGEGSLANGVRKDESPDSFDEDWDEPPPSISRTTSSLSATRTQTPRSPAKPTLPHVQLPRGSHSHSPTLPSPSASTRSSALRSLPPPSTPRPADPKLTLNKRQSTSFIPSPTRRGDESPLSVQSQSPAARSSPNLADRGSASSSRPPSLSIRRVPVPPLPPDIDHTRAPSPTKRFSPAKSLPSPAKVATTKAVSNAAAASSPAKSSPLKGLPSSTRSSPAAARSIASPGRGATSPTKCSRAEASLKTMPSSETLRSKKPSFWKRFSSGPIVGVTESFSPGRRKRSSSVGNLVPAEPSDPIPPLPPVPLSLRTPNGASPARSIIHATAGENLSAISRSSSTNSYVIESPSKPSRPFGIRPSPSVSSISSRVQSVSINNPSPSLSTSSHLSQSSRLPTPSKTNGERPRAFSPGFHLPSPSPGSPYAQNGSNAASDREDEDVPKSRRRIRPASAAPMPRKPERPFLNPQASTSANSLTSSPRNVHMPTLAALSGSKPSTINSSPTVTTDIGSAISSLPFQSNLPPSRQSTMRRLTSFGRKQGRRISGGWKFSTGSQSSSSDHQHTSSAQGLATVQGSPSKPSIQDSVAAAPKSTFPHDGLELGSPPKGTTRRPLTHTSSTSAVPKMKDSPSSMDWDWDETSRSRSRRERRPLSFNDFVIPDEVLARQKELRREIGAVKKFAGGVQTLKALVSAHDTVCDNVLATGTQADMALFVDLENEYTQWWEMATVLIEVGSTGTENATSPVESEVRTRRITLATEDARAAGEALSNMSSHHSSYGTVKSIFTDASGSDVFGSEQSSNPPEGRSSAGKADLSQRQLEMLRTMLKTPVSESNTVVAAVDERQAVKSRMRQSMPVAPTNVREVITHGPATVRAANGPLKEVATPNGPLQRPASPDATYVVPSPSYPSPETASALAQPKKGGLTGLRTFLRSLKSDNKSKNAPTPSRPSRPSTQRHRPTPINTQAAEKYGHTPPASPLSAPAPPISFGTQRGDFGSIKMNTNFETKRRRPSLKTIFRPGSGNWAELARPTTPVTPLPTIPAQGTPDDKPLDHPPPSPPQRKRTGSLARPPSIPALARLKLSKTYGILSGDSPVASPTKPKHRRSIGDVPPVPALPGTPEGEATLRLKSRILGLGHPSEASPSRASSSPARTNPAELQVPDEQPRSRSDGASRDADDLIIALTPENLPALLDYVKQCEKKLQEWKKRAVSLEQPVAV